jgi:biotin carboxyl carrier protein
VSYVVELEGGDRWEVSIDPQESTKVVVDGIERTIRLERKADGTLIAWIDGHPQVFRMSYEDGSLVVETQDGERRKARVENARASSWRKNVEQRGPARAAEGPGELRAPIAGSVLELIVAEGDRVCSGQPVLKLDAMKMQNSIASPRDGIIRFEVQPGQTVLAGTLLARLVPEETQA